MIIPRSYEHFTFSDRRTGIRAILKLGSPANFSGCRVESVNKIAGRCSINRLFIVSWRTEDIATGVESPQHDAASFIQCVDSVIRRTCEYPPVGDSWPRQYPSIRCESPDPFACLSINCANVCRQGRDENHVVGDCGGTGDRAAGII